MGAKALWFCPRAAEHAADAMHNAFRIDHSARRAGCLRGAQQADPGVKGPDQTPLGCFQKKEGPESSLADPELMGLNSCLDNIELNGTCLEDSELKESSDVEFLLVDLT